jgi:acyl-CoA thioesterase I
MSAMEKQHGLFGFLGRKPGPVKQTGPVRGGESMLGRGTHRRRFLGGLSGAFWKTCFMRRLWVLLALLLLGTLWFFWPHARVTNAHPRSGPIVVLGDSLSAGFGATPGAGYVEVLARRLNVEIVNKGVSGDTTAGGLARLDKDVLALEPALVVVELGANDFMRDVPRADTFANLDKIVERIQARGAAVLLLGVQTGAFKDDAASMYKALAQRRRTAYVPNIMHKILVSPELKSDYIHPNDAGYQVVADRVEPELRWLLKRIRP